MRDSGLGYRVKVIHVHFPPFCYVYFPPLTNVYFPPLPISNPRIITYNARQMRFGGAVFPRQFCGLSRFLLHGIPLQDAVRPTDGL